MYIYEHMPSGSCHKGGVDDDDNSDDDCYSVLVGLLAGMGHSVLALVSRKSVTCAPLCISVRCISLPCVSLYFDALYFPYFYCNPLYFYTLYFSVFLCTVFLYVVFLCISMHSISVHYIPLYCALSDSTERHTYTCVRVCVIHIV